jgi:hypothetical protein
MTPRNSRNTEPHATGQLARVYRRWTAIIGALVLLVLAVGSQAASSGAEVGTAFVATIVGFIPMLGVAHGLRHGLPWGRLAAFALPLCQVGFHAVLLSQGHAGPKSSWTGWEQFVRYVDAVGLYQFPVTAILAIMVWRQSGPSA